MQIHWLSDGENHYIREHGVTAYMCKCPSLSVCHYQSWYISWTLTFQHFHPVTKLIRCDDVKQCPARKGIALRSFHFPLPLSFLLACSLPTIIFLSCLETVHPLLRPLARPVPCSNIRLSKDVHGGDWSWKSLILGEKETDRQKYCRFDIFRKLFCNLCYETEVTVGHKALPCPSKFWRHWYTSLAISRILEQIDTVKKMYSVGQRVQHRSSILCNINQRWFAVLTDRRFDCISVPSSRVEIFFWLLDHLKWDGGDVPKRRKLTIKQRC